jgi:hypothetical protein
VIFLVGQCYPLVLPAHGPASCVKIIRREYGSLNQLAAEPMDLVRGKHLEKESLVLVFSGSHLARASKAKRRKILSFSFCLEAKRKL